MQHTIAIKIDVDTDRGTRIGVPNLLKLFSYANIPATFLFSLGPDNTGRAIKRIFRPGFLKKVNRSSVVSVYGIRTLLNGTLLPAPHIGRRNEKIIKQVQHLGHEVGIHCYDHIRWQDGLATMSKEEVFAEFAKARNEFQRIFGFPAKTAGSAGWQANAYSLAAYDDAQLLYASDTRGHTPFFPRVDGVTYQTLQIPSNLPTLDELIGRPEYPFEQLSDVYLQKIASQSLNILTIHAELEGMKYLTWFEDLIKKIKKMNVEFIKMEEIAQRLLHAPEHIAVCDMQQGEIDGRSGTLALQGLNCS